MKQIKLLEILVQKYQLKDGQTITKGELEEISNNEKIELRDLICILGCYYGIFYKDELKWSRINLDKKRDARGKIKLIKMDLKYLPEYGERAYTKKEIEKICKRYEVSIEDFITYVNGYKICYYENMEIIMRNKNGIWIGKTPYLSSDFVAKNYEFLRKRLEMIAKKIDNMYDIGIQEELLDWGVDTVLKRGDIEKNLSFDKERIINKLLYRAKFNMIDYAIKYLKRFKTNSQIDNLMYYEQYEKNNSIQQWLYPIKFTIIQRIILQEIIRRYNDIESRNAVLRNVYIKLDMKKSEFYNELKNIQKLILDFKKAKIGSDGRIIINEQI